MKLHEYMGRCWHRGRVTCSIGIKLPKHKYMGMLQHEGKTASSHRWKDTCIFMGTSQVWKVCISVSRCIVMWQLEHWEAVQIKVEWSAVEWSRVQWSVVECDMVQCSGAVGNKEDALEVQCNAEKITRRCFYLTAKANLVQY